MGVTVSESLTGRSRAAADYIGHAGWTQHGTVNRAGQVCMTGAVMLCQPRTGDEHVLIGVLSSMGMTEEWNDKEDRKEEEVVALLAGLEVSDFMLAAAFGPRWQDVVQVIRQTATLTTRRAALLADSGGGCHSFTGIPYNHEWEILSFSSDQSVWAHRAVRAVRSVVSDLVQTGAVGIGHRSVALTAARAMAVVAGSSPEMINDVAGTDTCGYVTSVWRRAFPEGGDQS
jgi:hypothetical protein